MSDQNKISLYIINTMSSRKVMRIYKKDIYSGTISSSNPKFIEPTSWELTIADSKEN